MKTPNFTAENRADQTPPHGAGSQERDQVMLFELAGKFKTYLESLGEPDVYEAMMAAYDRGAGALPEGKLQDFFVNHVRKAVEINAKVADWAAGAEDRAIGAAKVLTKVAGKVDPKLAILLAAFPNDGVAIATDAFIDWTGKAAESSVRKLVELNSWGQEKADGINAKVSGLWQRVFQKNQGPQVPNMNQALNPA